MSLTVLLRGLVDLLAPPRCIACDGALEPGGEGLCEICAPLVEPLGGAGATVAAFEHGGPLADAVRQFKYAGRSELARPLALLMVDRARSAAAGVDAIVPVPLHAARLRSRGYDQASLLAGELARLVGVPRRLDLLDRVRATPPQVTLDRVGRIRNVEGAFVASPRARGLSLLVLDDVRTTGSTLADASRALLAVGARRVQSFALTLASPDASLAASSG